MKYIKEYNSFSVEQIKKGIERSISNKDIDLKTNIDNIIDNIKGYSFGIGTIENFLYGDSDFISEAIPDKLIKYIEDNKLDIDISNLIEYNKNKKELYKVSDEISMLNYSNNDNKESELTELYLKEEELEKYINLLRLEVLNIKSIVLDKYPKKRD